MGPKGRGHAVLVYLGLALLAGCQNLRRNEPPIASFELSADEVYVGEAVVFDASSSFDPDGTIVSYEWDFGDRNKGSGEVVTHSYAEPGEYTVTLMVTDDRGAADTARAALTVLELPLGETPPTAHFTFSPALPKVDEEVVFDASASTDDGEILEYFWDFGDGNGAEGVQVRHRYVQPGTYTVRLEVVDAAGLIGRAVARVTVSSASATTPSLQTGLALLTPKAGSPKRSSANVPADSSHAAPDPRRGFPNQAPERR